MKGTTFAVLLALLLITLGIADAEAGGVKKKREAIPTVLAPAATAPTPEPAPPTVSPPPRVETVTTPPTTPEPPPSQVAEKKEPTCVWRSVSLPTKWEAAKTIQVQGMMVSMCDCCGGGQRQLWLHGSYVQVPPSSIQGTAMVLDCSTN